MEVFDIRLLGFEDAPGKDPVAELAKAFEVDPERARAIVANAPVLVKRGVDEATAERFFHVLRNLGADVRIERRVEPSLRPAAAGSPSSAPMTLEPGPSQPPLTPQTPHSSGPPAASLPSQPPYAPPPSGSGVEPITLTPSLPVPGFDGVGMDIHRGGYSPMDSPSDFGGASLPLEPSAESGDFGMELDRGGYTPMQSDDVGSITPSSRGPGSVAPAASVLPPGAGAQDSWFCDQCNVSYHEYQVKQAAPDLVTRPGFVPTFMCPQCQRAVRRIEGETHGLLLTRLLRAFLYPFQKQAAAIFAGLALVMSILGLVPFIGGLLSGGIFFAFCSRIINHTGDGEDDLPMPGDFVDLYDIIAPTMRFTVAILAPFVPAFLIVYLVGLDSPLVIPLAAVAILLGLAYMPASVMVASLTSGCLGALNPVAGVMIITRVPASYALTTIAVGAVLLINGAAMSGVYMVAELIPVLFLPTLIANAIGLVLPTVACRMLGTFLHHHRHELGLGLD